MRRIVWFILALLVMSLAAAPAMAKKSRGLQVVDKAGRKVGSYGGSHALIIGVADYTAGWPDLESVSGELNEVKKALEDHGFEVEMVLNPDSKRLYKAYDSFIDRHGFKADNRLLFYYSGHGFSRQGGRKGYLVPADAPDPRRDTEGFLRKALTMSQVMTWAREMESRHALFLFDSCFSGTIFKTKALPDTPPHISDITSKPVRQFISAGSAGETVPAQSVFTPAFVRALRGEADYTKDGYVTGTELGMYLHDKVLSYNTGQTPQYGKIKDPYLDEGDFVFRTTASKAPAKTAIDVAAERERLKQEKASLERQRREIAEMRKLRQERERLAAERERLERERQQLATIQPTPRPTPRPAPGTHSMGVPGSSRSDFVNTEWYIKKRQSSSTREIWIRLRSDDTVDYKYKKSDSWRHDGDDRWKLSRGKLSIIWTDGYSTHTYDLNDPRGNIFKGTTTSRNYTGSRLADIQWLGSGRAGTSGSYSAIPNRPGLPGTSGADFAGTQWHIEKRFESSTKNIWVKLRSDGVMGYTYTKGKDYIFDGTDSWKVEGGRLVLVWTNGYSTHTYDLSDPRGNKFKGDLVSESYQGARTGDIEWLGRRSGASSEASGLSRSSGLPGTRTSDFYNTEWYIKKRFDSSTKEIWIKLRPDGVSGYTYKKGKDYIFDGTDKWRIEGNELVITWTNGYSTHRYDLSDPRGNIFKGQLVSNSYQGSRIGDIQWMGQGSGGYTPPRVSTPSGLPGTRTSDFYNTEWHIEKRFSSSTKNIWIKLRPDGVSGYTYKKGKDYIFDGTDKWRIENNKLVIVWTNGYSTHRYDLSDPRGDKFKGVLTSNSYQGSRIGDIEWMGRGSGGYTPPRVSTPSGLPGTRTSDFYNTEWHIEKRFSSSTKNIWIKLRPDGVSGYTYKKGKDYIFDGTDKWRIENNKLVIVWTNGYSTHRYDLSDPRGDKFKGTLTSNSYQGSRLGDIEWMGRRSGGGSVSRASFAGTVWRVSIPGDNPSQEYVHLRHDGSMEYNYKAPSNFTHDGTDSWEYSNGQLKIIWTNGYATETYDVRSGGTSFSGTKRSRSYSGGATRPTHMTKVR